MTGRDWSREPWSARKNGELSDGSPLFEIRDGEGRIVCDGAELRDRALILSAPEVYEALSKIFSLTSYIKIHGVGDHLPPSDDGSPRPARVPISELLGILEQIGTISSAALAKADGAQ